MTVTQPQKKAGKKAASSVPFERVALLLQGGGALGAYQAGVYQALSEANLHPDWVAGISIGAINSALIVGNPPERRVERLRAFWEQVSTPPLGLVPLHVPPIKDDKAHALINQTRALGVLLFGARGFFTPRLLPPVLQPPGSPGALSFYDVSPLIATLERLVDFDRINAKETRLSVGAVNVRTGNFVYFDNATDTIRPAHILASGSLPPGFPATEIDGEYYWDGGLVSNTPLDWVLTSYPRKDTLAWQVDLWNARGEMPKDLIESDVRQKEIRFSSRTRASTDAFKKRQMLRRAAAKLLASIPEELRATPEAQLLASEADEKVFNIVQLIYRSRKYEGTSKDYEFSRLTMEEHWGAGYRDAVNTLRNPEVLQRPSDVAGVAIFDHARPEKADSV
jgi:NTE family protein